MQTQKMKLLKGNLIVVLVLGMLAGGIAYRMNQRHDSWDKLQEKNKVVVGIDDTFVPMAFRDKHGNLEGYDIELAKATFEKMGLEPDFQTIDWSMNQTELATGHIDVIWNGYTINDQRKEKVAFSEPYHSDRLVLLNKAYAAITKPADMKGKTLAVQNGSAGAESLRKEPQYLQTYLTKDVAQYDTYDKAINDVKVGRVDAVLIDGDYANYYLAHEKLNQPLKTVKTEFPPDEYGVGFRKEDKTLRNKVNQTLDELAQDGTKAKLSKKYFGRVD